MTAPRDDAALLKAVRESIVAGWSQDCFARDQFGRPVTVKSPDARRFDLAGAAYRATNHNLSAPERLARLLRFKDCGTMAGFNDFAPSEKPILLRIDTALARLSADENRENGNG